MLIKHRRPSDLPESAATPEHLFWNRRRVLTGAGTAAGLAGLGALGTGAALLMGAPQPADAQRVADLPDPTKDLYPAPRNAAFNYGDRPETAEATATEYNNFYEFGSSKRIARAAQQLRIRPWTVRLDGLVEEPRTVDVDTLIRAFTLEERLYRFRCVEAWAMQVPWTGFPLAKLVAYAKPLSGAKYLRFETFNDAAMAPGLRQTWYPWPYVEGVTMAEATNDLALMVTGAYGKPVPRQMGAPLRLMLPWKYGFKSIKSIVRISFTAERPKSFWETIQAAEYGFWANVNPAVSHPRWSQATEEDIGTGQRRPTLPYNGYAAEVADLYKGITGERLYT